MSAWHWQGEQLILLCHLQPGARDSAFVGLHGAAIKIRIAAPPVEGKANAALIRFLADAFGVRKNQIEILSGETSRHKRVAITSPQKQPEIPDITINYKNPQNSDPR